MAHRIECRICGATFERESKQRRTLCGDACRREARIQAKRKYYKAKPNKCVDCNKNISPKGHRCNVCAGASMRQQPCRICGRKSKAKNLCDGHYERMRRGQDLHEPMKKHGVRGIEDCSVDDCIRKVHKTKTMLCAMHSARLEKHGEVGQPEPLKAGTKGFKGDGSTWMHEGYVWCWHNGKNRGQHRVIMEEVLGRPLRKFENVHHINGIRDDNRPENLELWVKAQPCGQRASDLAEWVVETYPELVQAALAGRGQLRYDL